MASDRQQFNRARAKWRRLAEQRQFSVTADLGKTAIVSSYFTDEPPDTVLGIDELASFRTEAVALAHRVSDAGGHPIVVIDATRECVTNVIQDPEVATIYVIGNGSLSSLILDVKVFYDWVDVSAASTHLKLGSFVQRQCGGLTRATNVPMGLFAVLEPTQVLAALGDAFYPTSLADPVNDLITPIFTDRQVNYSTIKQLGSQLQHATARPTDIDRHRLAELRSLAQTLPKCAPHHTGDLTTEIFRHGELHRRVMYVAHYLNGSADDDEEFFVHMVTERFGFSLVNLYWRKPNLWERAFTAIEAKAPFDHLQHAHTALLHSNDTEAANTIDTATGHTLGIDAIGVHYWKLINTALDAVYAQIQQRTINGPFLCR